MTFTDQTARFVIQQLILTEIQKDGLPPGGFPDFAKVIWSVPQHFGSFEIEAISIASAAAA